MNNKLCASTHASKQAAQAEGHVEKQEGKGLFKSRGQHSSILQYASKQSGKQADKQASEQARTHSHTKASATQDNKTKQT